MAFTVVRATGTEEVYRNLKHEAFSVGVGSAHRADTYLTPLHYAGFGLDVNYEYARDFKTKPLMWTLKVGAEMDRTHNAVRNSVMYGAEFEARWDMLWHTNIDGKDYNRWQFGVGGGTTLDAGALYQKRNGNNPVAANASMTLDATALAATRFQVGKIPVTMMYRATLPFVGAMFAPDYGQLYYEIYMGDTKGIFTGAYWGRYFRLDQQLTADIKLGRRNLRLGYSVDIQSTKVHDIVTRRVNHLFVIGVSTDWLWGLTRK